MTAEYSTVVEPSATAKTSYLTTDHLGSPRVVTDAGGEVMARRDFMPFGEEIGAGVGPRTEIMKYAGTQIDRIRQRFTGYEKDDETSLDFAEARMYQNKHGRFTEPDPLLASTSAINPQTYNRYIYTSNNPINFVDPSGLTWCQASNGTVEWNGSKGKACADGTTKVDGSVLQHRSGPGGKDSHGNRFGVGDLLQFNENGTRDLIQREQDAARIAASTGAEVVAPQDEITTTDATTIINSMAPLATALSHRPLGNTTREEFESGADNLQLLLGTCGFIFDPCDFADGVVSAVRQDYVGGALSAPSAIPVFGIVPAIINKGRKAATATEIVSDASKLRNGHLANKVHPKSGVPFDANGFPDFSNHLFRGGSNDVTIKITGRRDLDEALANKTANYKSTPEGFTWHHHQDIGRMQLVDSKIHAVTGHTGGFILNR